MLAFIFILGLISLPATSGFVGEIMVTMSVFKISFVYGVLTTAGIILAPIYGLGLYKKVFLGVTSETIMKIKDITLKEFSICTILIIMIGWIGVYPNNFLRVIDATVQRIVGGLVA